MRAFTSLAGHILGSHPQINGYFEMHIRYDAASALDKQLEVLRQSEALKTNSRYLFDKLLHNEFPLNVKKPGLADVKLLVSLREPEPTIKSIVNLFASKDADWLYASPEEAGKYYIERVKTLSDFCRTVAQGYYYFDAEVLVNAPERLLPELERWLELDSPLNERYDIFSQTGVVGKGDSSEAIKSGRIVKTQNDYSEVTLPEEILENAQAVYRECREVIIRHALDAVTL